MRASIETAFAPPKETVEVTQVTPRLSVVVPKAILSSKKISIDASSPNYRKFC